MTILRLVGTCPACGSRGPARACCGQAVYVSLEPAPPGRPRFGQGPRKPLARVNKERMKARREAAFAAQARLARELPCVACQARPPSEPAHMLSRGAGGKDRDVLPLCAFHHDEQHSIGVETFSATYKLDVPHLLATLRNKVLYHACRDYAETLPCGSLRCAVCLEPVTP